MQLEDIASRSVMDLPNQNKKKALVVIRPHTNRILASLSHTCEFEDCGRTGYGIFEIRADEDKTISVCEVHYPSYYLYVKKKYFGKKTKWQAFKSIFSEKRWNDFM